MANRWPTKPLSDLTEKDSPITYGVVKPGEQGTVRFIRGGDIANGRILVDQLRTITEDVSSQYQRTLLRGGELLVSLVGNPGQVAIVPASLAGANIARQVGLVRLSPLVNTSFVKYFLLSPQGQRSLGTQTYGSVQQVINLRDLKTVRIPIPPLPVQYRIADILGSLDDKIELNRRMNRTLEKMAAAIFKSWFIDFDPVHYNAQCRKERAAYQAMGRAARFGSFGEDISVIDDQGRARPLRSEDAHRPIAHLFPDTFEHSDLGPIPKGWTLKPIGEAVRCVGGATPSTKNPAFWEGGRHPFVTPKDMSSLQSPVILDSERHITDAGVEKISSKQLPVGTVILSSRAPIGYLGVATVPVSVNQGVIAMICDRDLPNLYVLHWTAANMDLIKSRAGGTTFAEISKRNFRPIPIPVPSKPVLDAFMANAGPLHERIAINVRQNRRLGGLRDTLLPKLLSGEIELPEAEAIAEEVAP